MNINHKNLKLAYKLKDSLALATANYSLGWYHSVKSQNDSAYYYYYNAQKIYKSLRCFPEISMVTFYSRQNIEAGQ